MIYYSQIIENILIDHEMNNVEVLLNLHSIVSLHPNRVILEKTLVKIGPIYLSKRARTVSII